MSDWFRGTDLEGDERAVWEEKVRFGLAAENARERADRDRKAEKESARPCGRTVLAFGGRMRSKCWKPSGHEGDCE